MQTDGAFNSKFLNRMKATQVSVNPDMIEDLPGKYLVSTDYGELRTDMSECHKAGIAGVKVGGS